MPHPTPRLDSIANLPEAPGTWECRISLRHVHPQPGAPQQPTHVQVRCIDTQGRELFISGHLPWVTGHLRFQAPPLSVGRLLSVQVRVKHENGTWSSWSGPRQHTMFPEPQEFHGDWITRAPGGTNSIHRIDATMWRLAGAGTVRLPLRLEPGQAFTVSIWCQMGTYSISAARDTVTAQALGATHRRWQTMRMHCDQLGLHVALDGATPRTMEYDGDGIYLFTGRCDQIDLRDLMVDDEPLDMDPSWPPPVNHLTGDQHTIIRLAMPESKTPIVAAVLWVAATHDAHIFSDGIEIGRCADYNYPGELVAHWFDVTQAVGTPRLEIHHRWYGPGQGRAASTPAVRAQLHITYADETDAVVATGLHTEVCSGEYAPAWYRNDEGDFVELHDPTQRGPWHSAIPVTDDLGAVRPALALVQQTIVKPREIHELPDGSKVIDFGRVMALRPRITYQGLPPGRTYLPVGVFRLDHRGRPLTKPHELQQTDHTFPFVPPAEAGEFTAHTHLAWRYLVLPPDLAAHVTAVAAWSVHAQYPAADEWSFSCENADLQAVIDLLTHSARFGAQTQFVDTPSREKGQFLADAVNISYATMVAFGETWHTRTALRQFADSQVRYWSAPDELGRTNAVYPNGDGKRDIPDFTLQLVEWAEAYLAASGDADFVRYMMPYLRNVGAYVQRNVATSGALAGLVVDLAGGSADYLHGIVDWPVPGRGNYDLNCAARTTVNAQCIGVLAGLARLEIAVGEPAAAPDWSASATTLRAHFEAAFMYAGRPVDGLGRDATPSRGASQHALSFAASCAEVEPGPFWAAELLAAGVQQGPLTLHRIARALAHCGAADGIVALLVHPGERGFLQILRQGGTFTWETWEVREGRDWSQSHAWGAAVLRDFVRDAVGVRYDAGRLDLSEPVKSLGDFTLVVPCGPFLVRVSRLGHHAEYSVL